MIVGLHFRKRLERITSITHQIIQFLQSKKIDVWITEENQDLFPSIPVFHKNNAKTLDFLISIGGDGTFLHASQYALHHQIPIVGINYGYTGFLTSIEKEEVFSSLLDIIENRFTIEERSVMKATLIRNGKEKAFLLAVNDIVLQREAQEKILQLTIFLGKHKIMEIRGDGVIVATSTGSTAYSLSNYGPLVDPKCPVFLINPIASHSLTSRCVVVPDQKKVFITVNTTNQNSKLIYDGFEAIQLEDQDRIMIEKNAIPLKRIVLQPKHFFEVLQEKFNWS